MRIMRHVIRIHHLLAVVLVALGALAADSRHPALALSCSFDVTNINFGNVDLSDGTSHFATGEMTADCSGNPFQWVTICPNIGSGNGNPTAHDPRQMKKWGNSSIKLNFNLYWPGSSTIWGSYLWPYPERPPVLHLRLSWGGSGNTSKTIDARLFGGQNAHPKGVYFSRFNNNHILFQYKSGYSQDCSSGTVKSEKPSFRVRVRNVKSCTVSATDIDFGAVGNLASNVDATGTVTVRCTYDLPYKIRLDRGSSNASSPTQRKMSNGSDTITYGTYSDAARSQPWGWLNSNDVNATGTGYDQTFTTYGRVPPQTTPPPGNYSETIVVKVVF